MPHFVLDRLDRKLALLIPFCYHVVAAKSEIELNAKLLPPTTVFPSLVTGADSPQS